MKINIAGVQIATGQKERELELLESRSKLAAIEQSQAVIEFTPDGVITSTNNMFLNTMGYMADEVIGQHHRMFLDDSYANSIDYRQFWDALCQGETQQDEIKRIAKGGIHVWLQANYIPIKDAHGQLQKIVKYATDITAKKMSAANFESQITAISRSQAVIEFELDGTIITANDNFLTTVGYQLDEIQGKHHRIFVDEKTQNSPAYQQFWQDLSAGTFRSGQFKRINKQGKSIWIQATYNPIYDVDGKPFKVVKYASDITENKKNAANHQGQINAINKAQAVIEFELDGTIITANDIFLNTVNYTLEQIQGQHHQIFVDEKTKRSNEYQIFWQELAAGKGQSGEFKRFDSQGKEVWIQAFYNPILDAEGHPFKVVKFASDITASKRSAANFQGQIDAISKAQAVIEFELDGTIITANQNFLSTLGYSLEQIQGQHHQMFVDDDTKNSQSYQLFWRDLANGNGKTGEFKRINQQGEEIWIQAFYNPILDAEGRPFKIVKFATDITANKLSSANYEGQINAISKSQAVIEFTLEGNVIDANQNFLNTVGYSLEEIQGKHHQLFVDKDTRNSEQYRQFWQELASGTYQNGEYKRINKNGEEFWIQATYNPIFDVEGRPFKVVKFATDITLNKMTAANYEGQIAAINKAQAVIEFELDGTIITANDNFLATLGYSLEQVQGRHHRMFVDDQQKNSPEYQQFWQELAAGQGQSGEFKRINSQGDNIWIQAFYNPILDVEGRPYKIVKFATDITASKMDAANYQGQITAINKAQAVIEFTLDGTILTANDNFLTTLGYSLEQIQHRHHKMFVDEATKNSHEYQQFWQELASGKAQSGEFKRINSQGKDVWIQAYYNPILDVEGRPFKIVKFASDITQSKLSSANYKGQISAINKAQAVIEFQLDGTIINANDNFLTTMGYNLEQIQGKHHQMFVDDATKNSREYQYFWQDLAAGKGQSGEFKRINNLGQDVWIQAFYNPILDVEGRPFKIVKFATDITQSKISAANYQGQIDAIHKAQAVIEFELDGTIITANENFLNTVGYSLEEIQNKHHSLFVDSNTRNSHEYQLFWKTLATGNYQAGEFKRIDKNGKEIWIQASYNPILDVEGKPYKVVKFATDITESKMTAANYEGQIAAIHKAQAVIEFELDGTIITANDNFLSTVGYTQDEIKGKHHSLFVDIDTKNSTEYQQFWQKLAQGKYQAGEFKRISKSGDSIWIQASYNPILDVEGRPFKVVKFATDITQQKAQAVENAINADISNALKLCDANVMLVNNDLQVVYLNNGMDNLLHKHEQGLKTVLPQFDADNVLNNSVEIFNSQRDTQSSFIIESNRTATSQLTIAKYTYDLTTSPWLNSIGKKIGMVLEWKDRTEEVAIETEIASLINAAGNGDLSNRIQKEGKTGFFLNLAGGLNQLVNIADGVINETVAILDAMAHGDLTKRVTSDYKGIYDKLKNDANSTTQKLTEVIARINNASSAVANGAEEIARGNTDLSQRTEEQASSLEETASSMEEMTGTVRQNADNARVANDLALDATNKAQRGGEVVKRAVNSMAEINESSKKISDIIGVIDEIAFQTNLLALNAAVEAARAGEQGRGFAVVAGEVRNLAQRSAAAAKEIKDLIRDSVAKVQDGSQLVNESGMTLNEIVEAISRVTNMIADIANASNEQSEGIEQVNKAIAQMDEMTQQNAALVEEATAAGEAMADQARSMKQILEFFNAKDSSNSITHTPPMLPNTAKKNLTPPPLPVSMSNSTLSDDDEWEEF